MQTSYLDGQVFGGRLSKEMLRGKLNTMLSYRKVKFDYVNSNSQLKQNIAELDFSYQFNKKLFFSVNLEATLEKEANYNRVYLNLRKKF
jgi:predicted porin